MKILKDNRGTALITALLVMGVFLAISIALSSLIMREVRITGDLIDSGKAYFAAESGIETSLYKLQSNLPGWDTEKDGKKVFEPLRISEDRETVAEYKVNNTCSAYPCFDEGFDFNSLGDANLDAFYDVLALNESVTIPLFVVKNGKEIPVEDFTVEFYAPFNIRDDLNDNIRKQLGRLNGWDVLRWKIFGLKGEQEGDWQTESISDFTALSSINNAGADGNSTYPTYAKRPSWFGSVNCNGKNGQRYTELIQCTPYTGSSEIIYDENQESPIYAGTCDNTQAREHYEYANGKWISAVDCYPIKRFLSGGHRLNYLTLTNLVNPSIFKAGSNKEELSKLYYRVELFGEGEYGNETVRRFADITSNGYSGDSKQSINVKIARDSFMPVFSFSLYSTYKDAGIGEGKLDYWYEE